MVKIYAIALAAGFLGLIVIIFGGALAENLGRSDSDPGLRMGRAGRMITGGLVGFGMAGMSAEFAPLGFNWGTSLALAIVGGVGAAAWTRFAPQQDGTD